MINPFEGRANKKFVNKFQEWADEVLVSNNDEFVLYINTAYFDIYTTYLEHRDLWEWGVREVLKERLIRT